MNSKLKKVLAAVFVAVLVAVLGAFIKHSASANYDRPGPEEPCVPSEAWTEIIEHPEVTHEETVVVQEGQDAVWANFQPNNHKEPFVGPPSYPSDSRGSWNVHNQIPGGHEGPDGVYAKGNPDKGGNWFYRQAAVEEVTETVTVVDVEAWTETIEHPEVICETPTDPTCPPNEPQRPTVDPCDEPTDPCELVTTDEGFSYYPCDPTMPPQEPTEPESEIGDAISAKRVCIDFDEVKITHFINGIEDHVSFAPARPSDKCDPVAADRRTVPSSLPERYAPEEGM